MQGFHLHFLPPPEILFIFSLKMLELALHYRLIIGKDNLRVKELVALNRVVWFLLGAQCLVLMCFVVTEMNRWVEKYIYFLSVVHMFKVSTFWSISCHFTRLIYPPSHGDDHRSQHLTYSIFSLVFDQN